MSSLQQSSDTVSVCAIDFGSYGFASCFCLPGAPDHPNMVKGWSAHEEVADSNKDLAALLIGKAQDNKTIAIGYEAQKKYAQAVEDGVDDKYMYFEHFKPLLYSQLIHHPHIPCLNYHDIIT